MSTIPVSLSITIDSARRAGHDRAVLRAYGVPEHGRFAPLWRRDLELESTPADEPVTRLRQAAIAILEATGGLPPGC